MSDEDSSETGAANARDKDQVVVAMLEVLDLEVIADHSPTDLPAIPPSSPSTLRCRLTVRGRNKPSLIVEGRSRSVDDSIASAVAELCRLPFALGSIEFFARDDGRIRCRAVVEREQQGAAAIGVGRSIATTREMSACIAVLRAAHHAGWLKPEFSPNNQKALRSAAHDLTRELVDVLGLGSIGELKRAEAEGCVLESFNRIASAAVITATNVAKSSSALQLFDTSAWLYDSNGQRRDHFTDTDSWLAWYPGLDHEKVTIDEVLTTLPQVPASAIPWLIRLFENPESPFRFRGAIHLADHDVLHVLLGRGLQDQDEAFVLGFAMGTAKRVSRLQYHIFRWFMVNVYPEPYRIPKFVLPAFDIGVRCGIETGRKNLYRESLEKLKHLPVDEARRQCGIDLNVLRKAFREEQSAIPFTIASLRLPTAGWKSPL